MSHTAGPWHVGAYNNHTPIQTERGLTVAFTSGVTAVGEHDFANARLMAAAPTLLEAAQGVLNCMAASDPDRAVIDPRDGVVDHANGCLEILRQAIAKAEGRGE